MRRGYHFCNSPRSETRVPHPFSGKGGRFFSDAEKAKASLRKGRPAFHYIQLLRAQIALRHCSGAKSIRESAERGSVAIRVPFGWVRVDAGTCASADQRAENGDAVESGAGAEAESVSSDAREEEAQFPGTIGAEVSGAGGRVAAILAEEILRLQRMEFAEEEGEIELHERESGAEKTSPASEGLAVEQLAVLCARGCWIGDD